MEYCNRRGRVLPFGTTRKTQRQAKVQVQEGLFSQHGCRLFEEHQRRCFAGSYGILADDGGNQMPAQMSCAVDYALKVMGDRWTLGIIHELSLGPRRTVELHRGFKGLSTKTLLARLRKLERVGFISRQSFGESPPRVEYSLTAKGRGLLPVVREMGRSVLQWEDLSSHDPECKACTALNSLSDADSLQGAATANPTDAGTSARYGPGRGQLQNRKRRDVTLL